MATNYGKLKEYNSSKETWTNYVERLEFFFTANDIADADKKKAILLSASGPGTYSLFRNLCAPETPADKNYNELKELIKGHLHPAPNPIAERFKFNSRDRQPNEKLSNFLASLRQLTEHCEFGNTVDVMLRDRLVCGINNKRIQQRLLTEGRTLDLTKALEIALSMESAEENSSTITNLQSTGHPRKFDSQENFSEINKVTKKFPYRGRDKSPCYRCGGVNHEPDECLFKDANCFHCRGRGHISKVCPKRQKYNENKKSGRPGNSVLGTRYSGKSQTIKKVNVNEEDVVESDEDVYNLYAVAGTRKTPPLAVTFQINKKEMLMEVDTGASLTIMSERTFNLLVKDGEMLEVKPFKGKLRTYTGEIIKPIGVVETQVEYHRQEAVLPIVILPGSAPTLLGRNWLHVFKLDWNKIFGVNKVDSNSNDSRDIKSDNSKELSELIKTYEAVFRKGMGTLKETFAHIELKDNATPHYYKPRPVPYALKNRIDKELDRLVAEGVFQPIQISEWAAPIVPVIKDDGDVRICGDYKMTINKESICDNYPIPKTEDLFAALNGGEKFTKLDLAHAYQQVMLDSDSRKVLTINTHRGLFQPTRLQFGVHSASGIFQREMEKRLNNLPFTMVRVDDILISGKNDDDHLKNLSQVLEVLKECGLRLKKNKCVFMSPEVTYLGFKINKFGVATVEEKIEPLLNAPAPSNTTQLKSFLGMVNYYHRYLPGIASVLEPLHHLLRKGVKWVWEELQQNRFEETKKLLCSTSLLVHYDPGKTLVLQCDASPYGVGAVLSHVMDDNSERPIAYTSRTLTSAERNYSQIEKEALAIVCAVKKFHQYLYGRTFTLVTDHKPLLGLLSELKPIPSMCAARIQRWALLLSTYNYELIFRRGTLNGNADCMSRLPVANVGPASKSGNYIMMMELSNSPILFKDVKSHSSKDPVISRIIDLVLTGEKSVGCEQSREFKPYLRKLSELSVEDGTLLWGHRVVIPPLLQETILEELHQVHPGINRMKALGRSYVWWPEIDEDIEGLVRNCKTCQEHQNLPHNAPIHPWEHASKPWTRLHADYAGPFHGKMYLIIVDSYSKWLDVYPVSSASTPLTIEKLRIIFATHGLPEILVSDNASCFKSEEFGTFMSKNNIRHITGAPYKPQTNGLAERGVQTFKKSLQKLIESNPYNESIQTLISRFLFTYRITPHSSTGVSPAELLMGRKLNSVLSAIKPNKGRKWRMKNDFDSNALLRRFKTGDLVWVRNYSNGPKWISGLIERRAGPVSYEINARGCIIRRHIDQIRLRVEDTSIPENDIIQVATPQEKPTSAPSNVDAETDHTQESPSSSNAVSSTVEEDTPLLTPPVIAGSRDGQNESSLSTADEPVLRRSTRVRNPPKFLGIDD